MHMYTPMFFHNARIIKFFFSVPFLYQIVNGQMKVSTFSVETNCNFSVKSRHHIVIFPPDTTFTTSTIFQYL